MRTFWSARTRVLCGSAAFATAIAGFGGVSTAQPLGDGSTQPAAYHGPYLTWANKTGGPDAAPSYSPPPAQSTAAEFASWPAPAAPAAAPRPHPAPAQYVAPAQRDTETYFGPAPQPERAVKAYVAPAPKPRPTAVAAYVAPPAAPVHKRPPTQLAVKSAPAAPAQAQAPAPQQLAQNDTSAPASAPAPLAPTTAHYYSLHREYGLTPDAVVTPTERPMVLIGPPDGSSDQKQDNSDSDGGSDKHGDQEGADN